MDQAVLHLVDPAPASGTRMSDRQVRRTIERLQTKAFVHDAMVETGSASVYALEEAMMDGVPTLTFPMDRPKLCDRMARLGQPAVGKQLAAKGGKNLRTKRWFDKLIRLAPDAAQVLSWPLWRVLDPRPVDHVEWHSLGWTMGQQKLAQLRATNQQMAPTAAWQINVRPSDDEDEIEHFVLYMGTAPDREQLAVHLLALRRWEAAGDLIGYDLVLQQALRAAHHPNAAPDLAALQPDIGDFLVSCFGAVVVPYPELNLTFQRQRIDAGRDAWKRRVLKGSGVGQPGFDAPV